VRDFSGLLLVVMCWREFFFVVIGAVFGVNWECEGRES
jgi:hypothetical protein